MNGKGKLSEAYAKLWLISQGYKIIKSNYAVRGGEIDIIAKKGDILAFTEVKARKKGTMVSSLEAVTSEKQRKIKLAADFYLSSCPEKIRMLQPRFDVIAIEQNGIFCKVTDYIEDAFS